MFFDPWLVSLYILAIIHIRMSVFTIYVHRGISHNLFSFSKKLHHVFRFILWLTGFGWPTWMEYYTTQHRKHHRYSDGVNDPHSPHQLTFWQMFDYEHNESGRPYYVSPREIESYAKGIKTPKDWIQVNLYNRFPSGGYVVLSLISLILFGVVSSIITYAFLKYILVPLCILIGNIATHTWGYRAPTGNLKKDRSRNIFPFGILFGGEELHGNHHRNPANPKFSVRWWEIDISWMYIKILIFFKMMQIKNKI